MPRPGSLPGSPTADTDYGLIAPRTQSDLPLFRGEGIEGALTVVLELEVKTRAPLGYVANFQNTTLRPGENPIMECEEMVHITPSWVLTSQPLQEMTCSVLPTTNLVQPAQDLM